MVINLSNKTQAVVYSLSTTEFAMSNSREEFQGGYQQIFEAGEVVSIPPGQLSSKGVKRIIRVAFPQPSEDSLTKSMYNIFLEASRCVIFSFFFFFLIEEKRRLDILYQTLNLPPPFF